MMKIAVLSSSLSRRGGGVSEVALRLSQNLIKLQGVSVEAFGLQDDQIKNDKDLWRPIPVNISNVIGPASIGYSPKLLASLKASGADLIHLHGLWQYPSLACAKAKLPYLTTIHGMLDQWAVKNSGFKKQVAGFLYEKSALKKANCLQAFTLQEYNDIRNYGLKNPVCIIPNGVDIPEDVNRLESLTPPWKKIVGKETKSLLYLGRLHKKKGLTNLIKAWRTLHEMDKAKDWRLVVAGWDQLGYEAELKELVRTFEIAHLVHFIGPQFNSDKHLSFLHADGFILPSYSEGLPMAVLEAWSYKLPVLMTKHCNLPEGFEANAAIEISPTVESITNGLIQFFSKTQEEAIQMGINGKTLVSKKFSWASVSKQLYEVYRWILQDTEKPETIITD